MVSAISSIFPEIEKPTKISKTAENNDFSMLSERNTAKSPESPCNEFSNQININHQEQHKNPAERKYESLKRHFKHNPEPVITDIFQT